MAASLPSRSLICSFSDALCFLAASILLRAALSFCCSSAAVSARAAVATAPAKAKARAARTSTKMSLRGTSHTKEESSAAGGGVLCAPAGRLSAARRDAPQVLR